MTVQVTSSTPPSLPPATIHHSPWHSPVPYLFGGLAAMLTLVAFALVILGYSYWKLSNEMESVNHVDEDLEHGNGLQENYKRRPVFEDKYFVIMAGHAKPTFLATPISSSAALCGCCSGPGNSTAQFELDMMEEKEKQGNRESLDQLS